MHLITEIVNEFIQKIHVSKGTIGYVSHAEGRKILGCQCETDGATADKQSASLEQSGTRPKLTWHPPIQLGFLSQQYLPGSHLSFYLSFHLPPMRFTCLRKGDTPWLQPCFVLGDIRLEQ